MEEQIKQHILNTITHVEDMVRNFKNEYKVIKNDNGEFEYVNRTYIKEITAEDGKKYTLVLTDDVVSVTVSTSSLQKMYFKDGKITYVISGDDGATKTKYVCTYRSNSVYFISVNTFKFMDLCLPAK